MANVKLGIDRLQQDQYRRLQGKRVALFTNPSGVNAHLQSSYDLLWQADNVNLAVLFAPEHGISAAAQAGAAIDTAIDPRTGMTLFSLYGGGYSPSAATMEQIDIVVVDIQDVGARYYTFLWSMTYLLEACSQHHVEMLILDRPNPLGDVIHGPILNSKYASFIGRFPIPVQHGMTIGEMAWMVNEKWLASPACLNIIKCQGLTRDMTWQDTGLGWVAPSPNMPHPSTVQHYPGSCLIEGTNLSEGRGTALPFEIVGAPWIEGHRLSAWLRRHYPDMPPSRAISFVPTMSKYAGELCHGIQLHVQDDARFDALSSWLVIIKAIQDLHPQEFRLLPPKSQQGFSHFEHLLGIEDSRQLDSLMATFQDKTEADRASFSEERKPFLLYE